MKHLFFQKIGLIGAMLFFLFCCTEDNEPLWNAKEEREIQTFFETDGLSSRSSAFLDNLVSFIVELLPIQMMRRMIFLLKYLLKVVRAMDLAVVEEVLHREVLLQVVQLRWLRLFSVIPI